MGVTNIQHLPVLTGRDLSPEELAQLDTSPHREPHRRYIRYEGHVLDLSLFIPLPGWLRRVGTRWPLRHPAAGWDRICPVDIRKGLVLNDHDDGHVTVATYG